MRLLRDVHHIGRVQMLISVHDEQAAVLITETIINGRNILDIKITQILHRYLNRLWGDSTLTMAQKDAAAIELEARYDAYEWVLNYRAMSPWLLPEERARVDQDLVRLRSNLRELGIQEKHLVKIDDALTAQARAISAVATGLALNDIRTFMTAKSNRNLAARPRFFVRAIREGFQLEAMNEKFLFMVQYIIRSAKFKAGDWNEKGQPTGWKFSEYQCGSLFVPTF